MRLAGSWVLTAEAMQKADAATIAQGTPGHVLMERAGAAVARACLELGCEGRIVIVAGPGNNGGDGWAAAVFLKQMQVPVRVVALRAPEALRGDAAIWARRAEQAGVALVHAGDDPEVLKREVAQAALVVDAIFGTGLARALEGFWAEAARILSSAHRVLAVDLPSGVEATTGAILGEAVLATHTLPIAAYKRAHFLAPARTRMGRLLAPAPIGIRAKTIAEAADEGCARLLDPAALEKVFPPRAWDTHKGRQGRVLILGGAPGTLGAPVLAGWGAMAAGAGLVSLGVDEEIVLPLAAAHPELMVRPLDAARAWPADAIVAGPGWGTTLARVKVLAELLGREQPLVLDADALALIAETEALRARLRAREAPTVLTPHPGEAARLLGTDTEAVQRDRFGAAKSLAQELGCLVVLKGAGTILATPKGESFVCPIAAPQLAFGGAGDVLAGAIGALLARRAHALGPVEAAAAAVLLHALAGRKSWRPKGLAARIAKLRLQLEQG